MTAKLVLYAGRVQGVGFRQTTFDLAQGFAIAGYVRNLPSGDVEVLAQGEAGEVDLFLAALDRRMSANIRSRHAADVAVGDHDGFDIRY
jgi:acylphosphatase